MKKLISRLEKRRNTSSTSKACYERLENRQMLAGDSFWVYYGEGNKVFRSLNDGTQKQELMALTTQPGAVNADGIMVDLDRVNNKIYTAAYQGGPDSFVPFKS
jgi:hypothetical protein